MEQAPSFAEILNDKLSQKSDFADEKRRNFDSTLFEPSVCTANHWNFLPEKAPEKYNVEAGKFTWRQVTPEPTIETAPEPEIHVLTASMLSEHSDVLTAFECLKTYSKTPIQLPVSRAELKTIYRRAVRNTHPDLGGLSSDVETVLQSRDLIENFLDRQTI